jgi:3-hydroxyisobutyrate dehydrogenase
VTTVFIGMGLLGSNFVRAGVARGEQWRIHNRTTSKAEALAAELGDAVTVATDAAEAVRGAERVHLVLKDDASVDAVLAQMKGGLGEGTILVDHTTTSTDGTRARAERLEREGVRFVHAPVFMGPQNCRDATGIMLAAGPQALLNEVRPLLAPMTGRLVELGEVRDRAAAFKLMGNLIILTMTGGAMDALALARATGLSRDDLLAMLEWFNPGASLPRRVERVLAEPWDDASWELPMARKDAGLMMAEADRAGLPLFVLPAVAKRMDVSLEQGHHNADWTVIAKPFLDGWDADEG